MTEGVSGLVCKSHPDRPRYALGLCASCYQIDYKRRRRADPEYAAREAEYGRQYRAGSRQLDAQRRYREKNREQLREKGRAHGKQRREDPEYRARGRLFVQRYWRALKAEMVAAYGGKCSCCGETELAFLTLEHLNGDGKEHRARVGNSNVWADLKKRGWPQAGYTVLCFNCNLGKRVNGGKCPHESALAPIPSHSLGRQ